jgi:predicted enzyme related to lactoylglutathione lyase
MAGIERHPAGALCWVELGTTDVDAAKSLYGGLFGCAADPALHQSDTNA